MTNPKTLKDFKDEFTQNSYLREWDYEDAIRTLKQEAIKWIKHIQEDIEKLNKLESEHQTLLQMMATKGVDEILEGQIKWIKMFFDIYEVELK